MVQIEGDRLVAHFRKFDLAEYDLFLKCKRLPESSVEFIPETETYSISAPARFAPLLGVERPPVREEHPMADFLYPDQRFLVSEALDAKRFALWCQCGWGKTFGGWEFGRQVWLRTGGGRVLITTLNEVVPQWMEEHRRFYAGTKFDFPATRLWSRAEMRTWMRNGEGVAVTNYEKWNPDSRADQVVNEARYLAGAILDENRLKTGGGVQKWAIGKSLKGVEYKLSLTATPAPNAIMEYASQAMFLEKMRNNDEIIWTFFTRHSKTHRWTVKPHARAAFFEWMSSWSVYVGDPRRYGWRLDRPLVPPPEYRTVEVPATPEQIDLARALTADQSTGQLSLVPLETNAIQRNALGQLAKGFRYVTRGGRKVAEPVPSAKPDVVAGIVRTEAAAGAQVLVWTVFDAESNILAERLRGLPGVELLTGKTKRVERQNILERFRNGTTRVLITRASVLGWGMNLQFVSAMVFSGWTDSFEQLYQAVRRAFRDGQAERVRVYFPVIRELEGDAYDNVWRKQAEYEQGVKEQEDNYIRARARLRGEAA